MLVFGDGRITERPRDKLARVREQLAAADAAGAGIVRHGLLVAALIEAGELAQGVIDAEVEARGGQDARSPAGDALLALCTRIAGLVVRSWAGRLAALEPASAVAGDVEIAGPEEVETRRPEGFAFYCVYPEAYAASAGALRAEGTVRVVGLRSIGTTLSAIVAAALEVPPPLTVRPVGHPFERRLALAPALDAEIAGARGAAFAIVDEGPGLSGSSLAAVVSALEGDGVAPGRIHLLPSHANEPGAEASPETRAIWRRARRHVTTFDDLVLAARQPAHRLETWFADLIGHPVAPLEDISGGLWRRRLAGAEAEWPPSQTWRERRKFLLRTGEGTWLLKFAGLGAAGAAKLDRAQALSAAGFCPAPAGWRHGFLAESWRDDARPLRIGDHDRTALIARVGSYLAFRARSFPAPGGRGASLEALLAMARHNAGQAFGEIGTRLGSLQGEAARLQPRLRPIETDGRLHPWEWLDVRGLILKTDALDHHAGHDLVGCQDVAWDIVGASVELDLSPAEEEHLATVVERAGGGSIDPDLLEALRPCYLAFQLGSWTLSAVPAGAGVPNRTERFLDRYKALLRAWLFAPPARRSRRREWE